MNKGFSLLEVLIALVLASFCILAADFALTRAAALNARISQQYHKIFADESNPSAFLGGSGRGKP